MPAPVELSSRTRIAFAPTRGYELPAVSPPYLRGSNILYNPSFEGRVYDPDSSTFPVPYYDPACGTGSRWYSGACNTKFSAWVQRSSPYVVADQADDTAWKVSTAAARSGQYGAVWWRWQAASVPGLLAVQGFNHPAGLSARCSSGDTVTWGTYAKVSSVTGTPKVTLWATFLTAGGAVLRSNLSSTALTTSHALYTMTVGAPSNSYYLRVLLAWEGTGSASTSTYVDDLTLGVE